MKNKITIRKGISPKLRFSVFERDNYICQYCGRSPQTHECTLQADHIISVKNGGTNDFDNLITSCWDCNIGKGAKTATLKVIPDKEIEYTLAIERLEQVRALNEYQKKINNANQDIKIEKYKLVDDLLTGYTQEIKDEVRKLFDIYVKDIGITEVLNAIQITTSKNFDEFDQFIRYLAAILRNKKIEKSDPENVKFNKAVNYYYGKAKQLFGWQVDRETISNIVKQYKNYYIEQQLESCSSWNRFCNNLPTDNE